MLTVDSKKWTCWLSQGWRSWKININISLFWIEDIFLSKGEDKSHIMGWAPFIMRKTLINEISGFSRQLRRAAWDVLEKCPFLTSSVTWLALLCSSCCSDRMGAWDAMLAVPTSTCVCVCVQSRVTRLGGSIRWIWHLESRVTLWLFIMTVNRVEHKDGTQVSSKNIHFVSPG